MTELIIYTIILDVVAAYAAISNIRSRKRYREARKKYENFTSSVVGVIATKYLSGRDKAAIAIGRDYLPDAGITIESEDLGRDLFLHIT